MRRVFHHTETRASCCTIYTSELKVLQEIRTPAREPSFLPFAVDTPLHRPSLEHVSRFADIVHLFSAWIGILQLLSQIRFVSQQGFGRVAPFLCEVKGKSRLWVISTLFHLEFHRVTWPWWWTLTNGSDVKYIFPRCRFSTFTVRLLSAPGPIGQTSPFRWPNKLIPNATVVDDFARVGRLCAVNPAVAQWGRFPAVNHCKYARD